MWENVNYFVHPARKNHKKTGEGCHKSAILALVNKMFMFYNNDKPQPGRMCP